ncbi:MAG: hypothetical protein DCC71_02890 [Proteobacteria bacterium]|nr:MAG: hypothetical protein DCC71_02890 [Pseudomonadota bacterium]
MANLNAQPYGLDGSAVNFDPADPAGEVAINRPGLMLAVTNGHASETRTLTLEAVGECNAGELHDVVGVSIPPTPAGGQPLLIPLGWDGRRFSRVSVAYDDAADLEVALVYVDGLRGIGEAAATPPALGASPGTVARIGQGQGDELALVAAAADGMLVDNSDGRTGVVVANDSAADRVIHVHARNRCSDGFLDHYSVTVAAGDQRLLPRFRTDIYGTRLAITYSSASQLSFGAIRHEIAGRNG